MFAEFGGRRDIGMFSYYDHDSGEQRIKRRYLYAGWAFAAGIAVGFLLGLAF